MSIAGFRLTQKNAAERSEVNATGLFICGIFFGPRGGSHEALVDALHVLYALGLQPFLKRIRSTTDEHTDSILPGGAPTEDATKMDSCFRGQLKSFIERAIAHAGGEKQERFGGYRSGLSKKL